MTDGIRYAPLGSVTLAYETFGEASNPPLVLIMGLGAQMLVWPDALCRSLAGRGYYVVRFDNRDVGLSSKLSVSGPSPWWALLRRSLGWPVGERYDLGDMAQDVLALMDHLGLVSAHIAGASMGGMIAQILAARYPHRVRSLIPLMSESGAPGRARPDTGLVLRLAVKALFRRNGSGLENQVGVVAAIGSRRFPTPAAELRERLATARGRCADCSGAARQWVAILATGDRRPLLGRIRCPVTIIHGDEDALIPPEGGQDLARHIVGARFELIHGMGHDFPRPLLSRIERLMARQLDEVEEQGRAGLCWERQDRNRVATGAAGSA